MLLLIVFVEYKVRLSATEVGGEEVNRTQKRIPYSILF